MKLHKEPGYLYDEGCLYGIVFLVVIIAALIFWYVTLPLVFIVFLAFGFKTIPIGHKGLLTQFGRRTNVVYDEGLAWHLPIVTSIEVVDFRDRFIEKRPIKVTLINMMQVELLVSVNYSIGDAKNYFNNQSVSDIDGKIISELSQSFREFITGTGSSERELVGIQSSNYDREVLDGITDRHLRKLGIQLDNLAVETVLTTPELRTFYEVIREAEFLQMEKGLTFDQAFKSALLLNSRISQSYYESDTALAVAQQIKRLGGLGASGFS